VDKSRLWMIGAVLVIVAIIVMGWVVGIAPKLSEARQAEADRVTTVAQNAAYDAQITTLKKEFDRLGELQADVATIQEAVPGAPEIPALIEDLSAFAQASNVVISGVTQSDAQAFDPTLLGVPAAVAPVAKDSAAATPAPSTATGSLTAVDPRITPSNFVAIPLTIVVEGSYDGVLDFVSRVQHGRRLVLVNGLSVTVPNADGAVTGTMATFVYVLLDPGAVAATPR